jgi:predicted dehydrogenase
MRTIPFGIIGCGLMGREFAGAAARWGVLSADIARPQVVAACDVNPANLEWFRKNVPGAKVFSDHREMLVRGGVEAVYVAVPHNLHERIYTDAIEAGKHLMGEKPFGMDMAQNGAILASLARHPGVFARCASEFPYYPAMQLLIRWIKEGRFGRVLELRAGFRHSSDMDVNKPINWKRTASVCGEYGCMGDLGIHTQHVPFRMGFLPKGVYARLDKFVSARPDGKGGSAPCDTWDNATLVCDAAGPDGLPFTMYLETKRMAPGCTNDWYFELYGMKASARFTTSNPNVFSYTADWGREQAWANVNVGHKPIVPTVTGSIFEFGFTDAILQMWAAFMLELEGKPVAFGCFTPEETRLSHALQTAALRSHAEDKAIAIDK